MRTVLSLLIVTAAASTARADQCEIVEPKVATKALELARKSKAVLELCEPCGDKAPRGPYRIVSSEIKNGRVQINGRTVDLAYTFLHTRGETFTNLATAAGCRARGVSASVENPDLPLPPPPPPPSSPSPPRLPPPTFKRVTSTDDIGGTWMVTVRPAVSTCILVQPPSANPPARSTPVTWTITSTNGDISVMTDDGHELLTSGATLGRYNMLDLQVTENKGKRALKLHQFSTDTFDGKLVVIEQRSRTCATSYDLWARRAP